MEVRTLAKILHKNQPCTMPAYDTWCLTILNTVSVFRLGPHHSPKSSTLGQTVQLLKCWQYVFQQMTQPKFKTQQFYTLDTGHR
jgi:hypothetical protein